MTMSGRSPLNTRLLFLCFLLSGFTSLLYQTIWMRLALARFGVNTSIVSTVLTVFMLGLAMGTMVAGRWTEAWERRWHLTGLELYAAAELCIAIGGWAVPTLLDRGRQWLLSLGAMSSLSYTIASALVIGATLWPFCLAMGATVPTALSFLKRSTSHDRTYTFSFLYLANVVGAVLGVLGTALVLIEALGFRRSETVGVGLNICTAAIALLVAPATGRMGSVTALTDDRPVNEFFFLRRYVWKRLMGDSNELAVH